MANLQKCKRCGADIGPTKRMAFNQRFCGADCRDTWWNEFRSKNETQATVAEKRLGVAAPDWSLTDVQAAWMAALIDGEGTIGIWRERRKGNSSGYRYRAAVQVNNTSLDIIKQARYLVDGWSHVDIGAWNKNPRYKILYRATVNRRAVLPLLKRIREYLVIKQKQADVVMKFCRAVADAPMRASQDHEIFDRLYEEVKAMNRRGRQEIPDSP